MNPVFKLSAAIIFLVFGVFGCQEQIKTSGSSLEVVFEEDFESPEDYQKRWQATSGWSLMEGQIDGRKTKVLDIKGGNEGLSVQGGLADFDYEADLRVVKQGGGFLFRARDSDNLYMLRLVSDNAPWDRSKSPVLTDSFYPHTKKNGKYSADVKQPLTRRLPMREWFHIKFEVRGNRFKIFLGETRSPDRMELVGQWEEKKPFKDGRFGFRCSGSEHLQVDNIRISTPGNLQPRLVIKPLAPPRMITTGQSFDVKVHVQNTGWKSAANMQATLSLPPGLELVQGSPTLSSSTLKIGADRWFSWKVKTTKAVAARMQIAVTYDGLPVARKIPVDYVVNPASPVISAQPAQEAAARIDAQDNVILENQNLRMVFVKNLHGYTAAVVSAYDGKQWRQMAVSQPIGKISYRANAGFAVETVIIPTQYEILNPSGAVARVRFTSQLVDDDNVTWSFAYTFELEADKSNIKTNYQAFANNNRQLLYFQGPDLYAGEGSFGSSKDLAIFPGLEYLQAEEQSSSTRDMANFITFHKNAVGNRYVPHPHKITMPLMGLEQNNGLIGLMWDPLQKWGGDYTRPAARFASPNYIEKQENHLMGLFLPSVPDFVPENDDAASSPYPLTANSQVTLEAYIVAQAPGEVLDMLDQYYAIFGMPEKIDDLSITYEEALEWGRVGYMETIYDPATNGIRLWEQSPSYPAPGAIATLFRLSLDITDPAKKKVIRDRVDVMVNRALSNEGVRGLTDWLDGRHFPFDTKFPAGCLLRTHMLPFYIGYLEEGIAAWKTRVYEELINTQRLDGTWEYAGDMRKDIRQGDDIVSGTIAELVGGLLKYARITGDKKAFDAGMKGLEVMNSFIVPRGQNTWEVSKYTPDIQAAGLSVWGNLEAYEITGDQKYIEKAKYWAKTGVPFIYHWEQPGLNVMKYSTIPVFGATWYDFIDWLARPVQWCGLPLGYNMIKLAEYDQSFPWKILGEGIMDGAIQQMLFVVNEKPGLYADWIQFVGPYISGGSAWEPEGYMKAIFLSQGQGVEVDTKVLHAGDRRVHVSTGGVLKSAELVKTDRGVSFELEYPAGETSYAVVAGLGSDVKVKKNGRVLARTDDLEAADEGWKVSADGLLLLKIKHDKLAVRIDVAR
ncbi:MAG: hypothetical protein FVQ82_08450 [Planctomycetes bacterium]|nr:hypothetical protein [Planctomycetota bacterium]